MLTAAPPALAYEGAPGVATLEKPVDVLVGPVDADGTILGPGRLRTFGYFLYRRAGAGTGVEVWDDTGKRWAPAGDGGAVPVPAALAYQEGEAALWRGIIVAAGGTDAGGQPQFEKAVAGYPLYSVRAYFVAADGAEAFLTGPSENVAFAGVADRNLVVMGAGDGEEIASATMARFLLRSSSLQDIGGLRVVRDSPGARVTIENAAGASIVLHPDGRIELTPAPGQGVVVNGDLETERLTYRPAGGGGKQVLP